MYFEVRITKQDSHWLIEAPAFDVITQAKTKKEAALMLKDAIELLVDEDGFEVKVTRNKNISYLSANNKAILIALLLRRQRQKAGLTLLEIAERMGSKSPNAFARYEQGKAKPTVSKLTELIEALNPDLAPILKLA